MKNVGYYNGRIAPIEEMTIPMNDRAVYFGDGVYDAAFVRNGRIFAYEDHINRFYISCAQIGINFEMPRETLLELLLGLCGKLDSECGGLYWHASRGTEMRAHAAPDPEKVKPNLLVTVKPLELPDFHKKISLCTVEDRRYEFCNVKTLNLLPNVLASTEAASKSCDEAVFHRGDVVTECSHSNISIIKNGRFVTHPLDCYILPGTVRKQTVEICEKLGIPVDERTFSLEELIDADEAVITSSFGMIRSGKSLDGREIGGKAGDILKAMQDEYRGRLISDTNI